LDTPKFHEIWVEQCEAAEGIKRRNGTKAAFDYLVAEKLFNFADAANSHPAFARQLPRFVARVRGLFTVEEMRTHLNRIEREQQENDASIEECDNFDDEDEHQKEHVLGLESYTSNGGARSAIRFYRRIIDRCGAWDVVTA
jgi:DNA-binding SARP family transcriptional activator